MANKRNRNDQQGSRILMIVLFILIIIFLASGIYLIKEYAGKRKAEKLYENMRIQAISKNADIPEKGNKTVSLKINDEQKAVEAIEETDSEYPDAIGWISITDTRIDYPIMQADDNEYYLTHLSDGSKNRHGAIFADCRNADNFSDRNTILYGHNMKDGSMFGDLDSFKNQEYFDKHRTAYIYADSRKYEIEFFAGNLISANDENLKIDFIDSNSFIKYVDALRLDATVKNDVEITDTDRIITLVTCSYETDDLRFIITGKLIYDDATAENK